MAHDITLRFIFELAFMLSLALLGHMLRTRYIFHSPFMKEKMRITDVATDLSIPESALRLDQSDDGEFFQIYFQPLVRRLRDLMPWTPRATILFSADPV